MAAVPIVENEPAVPPRRLATIDDLLQKMRGYLPQADLSPVRQAYEFAAAAHEGQRRGTGEPYVQHPLETAIYLADLQLDRATVEAGLLHDVPEDTDRTLQDVEAAFGPEVGVFILIVLVIGGFRWMPVARLVRAQFFSLREKEFVEAARALGASVPRQVVRHILPNSLGPVIVAGTIDVAAAIIAESTLSFLGLGFPPDIPTWGRILYDAKEYLDIAPHWALFPGTAVFLAVMCINFVGDGLRDALDPRQR
jgi:hypothetical protein